MSRRRSPAVPAVPVVLVEDIPLLREGITSLLRTEGLRVVAAATSGEDAVHQVRRLKPRLVLLDSAWGNHDGVALVDALTRVAPDTKVVVMDLLPDQEDIVDFVRAGASGFILKEAKNDDLIWTLRAVASGMCVLPPPLAGVLFSYVGSHGRRHATDDSAGSERGLTHREREVAELIAGGLSNKEIGHRLHITVHTVKCHVHSVLEKLDLRTRLQISAHTHAEAVVAKPGELARSTS